MSHMGMCTPKGMVFAMLLSENGYLWSGIEYAFQGSSVSVRTHLLFQFQMSKREREICKFEMVLRNLFCCCSNLYVLLK